MENFIEDRITLVRVIYYVHCYCMYVIHYIIIILLRALIDKSLSGKLLTMIDSNMNYRCFTLS